VATSPPPPPPLTSDLSKLKFLIDKSRPNSPLLIQLIALSATIQNIEDLASWFRAALYVTTYRPVPLREMVCAGLDVLERNGNQLRKLEPSRSKLDSDSHAMLYLCFEGLKHGQQVIIFCSSRNQCETSVKLICQHFHSNTSTSSVSPFLSHHSSDQFDAITQSRKKILEEFKRTYPAGHRPTPSQELLEQGIQMGVAYHHAGVTRTYFFISHSSCGRVVF
jgi:helicase